MDNKIKLLDIYDKAKKMRIVLNQSEFADKLGYSRAHLFKKMEKIPDSLIERAEQLLETESVVKEPAQDYIARRLNSKLHEANTVTYYEVGAMAGPVGDIFPVKKSEGVLHISDLFRGSQFAIRVSGNSMMPNYPPGAIIGIREVEDKQITPGSVYVIEKGNELWIKRLFYKDDHQETGMYQCVSDNTMKFENGGREGQLFYPPFHVGIDQVRRLFKVTGIYKANELMLIK